MQKGFFCYLSALLLLFIVQQNLNGQSCDCTEMIYLNEVNGDGAIHKFIVNSDSTLTEIGTPWFDNLLQNEDVTSPHGLATDLNGNVYVGETSTGSIRKFNCDGEIYPTTGSDGFEINTGGTNFGTIDNHLFVNRDDISMFDLCSGNLEGQVQFCEEPDSDWGFYVDPNTNEMYATAAARTNRDSYFWYFDQSDFDLDPNTCVSAIPLANYPGRGSDIRGVTTDDSGNVYIVVQDGDPDGPSYLLKYGPAPTFNYIGASATDGVDDGVGYNLAIGIVYSETTGLLYVSTESQVDDCVSVFDKDLNYLATGVPSPGGSTNGKGISIVKECCPVSNSIVIDTILCDAPAGQTLSLQELIDCDGSICEGIWEEGLNNTGITYDACNASVTLQSSDACGYFSLESDGLGANKQCAAFTIEVYISATSTPSVTVSGDQSYACPIGAFSSLVATTSADSIQWQMSTLSCSSGFIDIAMANSTSYTPSALTDTTYFRALVFNKEDCASSSCMATSGCVIVNVEEDCCPDPNCYEIEVSRN